MPKAKVTIPVRYRGEEFEVNICFTPERAATVLEAYGGRVDVQESLASPRTDATVQERLGLWRVALGPYIARVQRQGGDWPERVREALRDNLTVREYVRAE